MNKNKPKKNLHVYLDIIAGSTALGRIEIELFYDLTPKTAENFRGLCTGEYNIIKNKKNLSYKGTKFFEIKNNNYIIGGDIQFNNGKGSDSIYGKTFNDENFFRRHSCPGLLSTNNKQLNCNNSQFIITLKSCPELDDKHTVFGQVVNGMDVVKEISNLPCDSFGKPKVNVFIFECGDYDRRRIHLREDVFKEAIDDIIERRKKREVVNLLGPEQIEEFYKKGVKRYTDIGNFEEYTEEKNDIYDLKDDVIIKKIKNEENKSEENDGNDDDSNSSDEDENKEKLFKENIKNNKDKDMLLQKYKDIQNRINLALKQNEKIVKDSNNNLIFNNSNFNKIKNDYKEEKEKNISNQKTILNIQNLPENKNYIFNSINHCDKEKEYLNKKQKNKQFGYFNTDNIYRSYKNKFKDIPFDKDLYEKQIKNGYNEDEMLTEEKKNLMKNDILSQIEKRNNFSRRRTYFEEEDVDYVDERNRKFNKRLRRAYGKESNIIRANLERGTAL